MYGRINKKIEELLEKNKMSQKQLANITGLTESAISHYVKGDRVPRGNNLNKIAKALGVTVDYLLNDNKEVNKEEDMILVKSLIARNASNMTNEEKMELLKILMDND